MDQDDQTEKDQINSDNSSQSADNVSDQQPSIDTVTQDASDISPSFKKKSNFNVSYFIIVVFLFCAGYGIYYFQSHPLPDSVKAAADAIKPLFYRVETTTVPSSSTTSKQEF